ncbi:hypothetical protein SNEBB_008377 [Seison nebaliae]|nr:hypothetical protein SNEBB_008377 [Seison nebaliae]
MNKNFFTKYECESFINSTIYPSNSTNTFYSHVNNEKNAFQLNNNLTNHHQNSNNTQHLYHSKNSSYYNPTSSSLPDLKNDYDTLLIQPILSLQTRHFFDPSIYSIQDNIDKFFHLSTPATTSFFNSDNNTTTSMTSTVITTKSIEDFLKNGDDFYKISQLITACIFYPIVCAFGIVGNLLTFLTFVLSNNHNSTNVFLTYLALWDLIKLINDSLYVLIIFTGKYNKETSQNMFVTLYPISHYFMLISMMLSSWMTVAATLDRCFLVTLLVLSKKLCTVFRAKVTSSIIMITCILIGLPSAFRYKRRYKPDEKLQQCNYDIVAVNIISPVFQKTYQLFCGLVQLVIPCIIMIVLTLIIIRVLHRARVPGRKMTQRHRITAMLILINVIALVCLLPDTVLTMLHFDYASSNGFIRGVREITDLLVSVKSAVNFPIYFYFSQTFRKDFILICFSRYPGMKKYIFSSTLKQNRNSVESNNIPPRSTSLCTISNDYQLYNENTLLGPSVQLRSNRNTSIKKFEQKPQKKDRLSLDAHKNRYRRHLYLMKPNSSISLLSPVEKPKFQQKQVPTFSSTEDEKDENEKLLN